MDIFEHLEYTQFYEDWFETADKILWTSACAHREGIILCKCAKENIEIMRCSTFLPFVVFLPLVSPSYQVILFNEIMQALVTFSSFDWWYLRGSSHVIGYWATWLLHMVGGAPDYHDPRWCTWLSCPKVMHLIIMTPCDASDYHDPRWCTWLSWSQVMHLIIVTHGGAPDYHDPR